MIGNSGSVKDPLFFVYSFPHSFFTSKQGQALLANSTSFRSAALLSQGWAGWKTFAFYRLIMPKKGVQYSVFSFFRDSYLFYGYKL